MEICLSLQLWQNPVEVLSPPSCSAMMLSNSRRRTRSIVHRQARAHCARVTASRGCWENWDKNFSVLQEIAAFLEKEGRPGALELPSLRALPPVMRPGKMLYAAQNFQEHVDEMLRAGMTPASGPKFTGDKSALCLSSTGRKLPAPVLLFCDCEQRRPSFACRPKKADVRGRNSPDNSCRLCPLHSWRSN